VYSVSGKSRSNKAAVLEWYGLKPAHDPGQLKILGPGAGANGPRTLGQRSGFSNPRECSVTESQGFQALWGTQSFQAKWVWSPCANWVLYQGTTLVGP
jgi:hypothetical protein